MVVGAVVASAGCTFLPQVGRIPVLHNPFPQVQRVAIAPFFNLSEEATVDGRRFALAYYNALQSVPGFEVIPVGQVERAMEEYRIGLNNPEEACRLAQLLGADAIVIGAVTDYSPYYPPRLGLRVEWYPARKELPWALEEGSSSQGEIKISPSGEVFPGAEGVVPERLPTGKLASPSLSGPGPGGKSIFTLAQQGEPPSASREKAHGPALAGIPQPLPLVTYTRIYNGHDTEFTSALSQYYLTRDDARFGGWQTYLERSDDFIRFCCYKHLEEMLVQQGGASQTKLVWRWGAIR